MTLWHLHIPKCGGTTLDSILKREYPDWRHIKIWRQTPPNAWQYEWGTPEEVNSTSCVAGHITISWLNMLARQLPAEKRANASYPEIITMLRDPVSRLLSLYHYLREVPQVYREDIGKMSFAEFVVEDRKDWQFLDNDMTRRWSGMSGRVTRIHLDTAIHNLEHCRMIGITEFFDESVERWSHMLGWSSTEYTFERMRVGTEYELRVQDLPTDIVSSIAQRQWFDYQLYMFALNRDWK